MTEPDPRCSDCGCSEYDHVFGDCLRAYRDQLVNDGEAGRDGPNPCTNCEQCWRDPGEVTQ